MASIKEERTKNKHLSFKIRVCLGRDENGKQISKAMRWHPLEGMTPAKARKEVQRVAAVWEAEQLASADLQEVKVEEAKVYCSFCVFKGFYCIGVFDNSCNIFRRLNIVNLYHIDDLLFIGFITNLFVPFGWGLFVISQLFEDVIIGGASFIDNFVLIIEAEVFQEFVSRMIPCAFADPHKGLHFLG